jgi:hypothetical protein
MKRLIAACPLLLCLPGCAHMGMDSPAARLCKEPQLVRFVGMKADAALGHKMLLASGAHEMRWAPPGSMQTMEVKPGRLTVSYDEHMMVTAARCG